MKGPSQSEQSEQVLNFAKVRAYGRPMMVLLSQWGRWTTDTPIVWGNTQHDSRGRRDHIWRGLVGGPTPNADRCETQVRSQGGKQSGDGQMAARLSFDKAQSGTFRYHMWARCCLKNSCCAVGSALTGHMGEESSTCLCQLRLLTVEALLCREDGE